MKSFNIFYCNSDSEPFFPDNVVKRQEINTKKLIILIK